MGASLLALAKSIYYPILPFGSVACTVFATTFLEIAVYISYIHTYLMLKTWSRGTNSRFAIVPLR